MNRMKVYERRVYEIKARPWYLNDPHPKIQQSPYDSEREVHAWTLIEGTGNVRMLNWNEGWIETPDGGNIVNEGDYVYETPAGECQTMTPHKFEYKYKLKDE